MQLESNKIQYLIGDPAIPQLIKEVELPSPALAPFNIVGYAGGGYEINTPEWRAANIYVALSNALNDVNTATERPINGWAATKNLIVLPTAGEMLNAYYNRLTLSFFYGKDGNGNIIYTGNSPKIVCHELGHAVLDFYRPDLWNTASLEIWAFHEFFGDFIASMAIMLHDEALNFALHQTNNNLSLPNVIANIGEQMASALHSLNMRQNKDWLRSGINQFIYFNPTNLPNEGGENDLIAEPHRFSQIMTGAIYDIFLMMFNHFKQKENDQLLALRSARETLGKYVLKAILTMPTTVHFFEGFARTLLVVDYNHGGNFQSQIYEIFINRRILNGQFRLLSQEDRTVHDCKLIRLSDHFSIRAQSYNPLYDVHIEIPAHDKKSILAAQHFVHYLHRNNKVSDSHDTPFQITNGKLIRSHFICGGCYQADKFQPEYYKPYKPQNNAGCGCNAKKTEEISNPKPVIKRGCYLRYQIPR